ncbi:MAG: serine/threonine-protein kinase [Myxococcota bacterium]
MNEKGLRDSSILRRTQRTVASSGRKIVDGLMSSGSRLSWFGLVAALVTLMFVVYFQGILSYATRIGAPLAESSAQLEASLDRSLVELRGWVAYQEPLAPERRREAWARIDEALERLQTAARQARRPELQAASEAMGADLRDLRVLQWMVEDVAGTPGNARDEAFYRERMLGLRRRVTNLLAGLLDSGGGDGRAATVSVKTILLLRGLFLELDLGVQRLMRTGEDADREQLAGLARRLEATLPALQSGPPKPGSSLVEIDQAEALMAALDEAEAYLSLLPELIARTKRPDMAREIFEARIRPVLEQVLERTRGLAETQRQVREQVMGKLFGWSFVVLALALLLAGISGGSIWVQTRLQRRVSKAMARARSLGQYALLEKIGSGAMGEVYRAEHRLLQRPSALKLLKGSRAEDALRRFEDEVRLTSRLTHPNTIAIYDYGRTPDGVFYYVMELLTGVTLDVLVERTGPVSSARALHILRQISASLAEAHEEGLLHRDVKPSNVMLSRVGGVEDVVKVLDFGLVTRTVSVDVDKDVLVGTPRYMAPEVIEASASAPASDVYAVGCLAYFLLTGQPVFDADSVEEVLSAHLHQVPVPPSERAERDIPPALEIVVLGCLAKDPLDRPDDARALARILAEIDLEEDWSEADAEAWWSLHGESLRSWVNAQRQEAAGVLELGDATRSAV